MALRARFRLGRRALLTGASAWLVAGRASGADAVDSLLARKGADALKLDPVHLTPQGYRLIAEEVVRVLEDLGVLDEEKS